MAKPLVVQVCVSDSVTMITTDGSAFVSVDQVPSPSLISATGKFVQGDGDFVAADGHSAFLGSFNSPAVQVVGINTAVVATGSGNTLELRADSGADINVRALAGSTTIRAEGAGKTASMIAGTGADAVVSATSGNATLQSSGVGHTAAVSGVLSAGVHVSTNAVVPTDAAPILVENIGYNMSVNVGGGGNLTLSNTGGNILNLASQVASNVANFGVQATGTIELQGSGGSAQIIIDLPAQGSSVTLKNTGEIAVVNPIPTSSSSANFIMAGVRLVASDPDAGSGFPAPVNSFALQTADSTWWYKFDAADTDWSEVSGGGGGGGQLFDTVLTPPAFSFPNNDVPLALGNVTLVKYQTDFGGTSSRAFRGLVNSNGGNQIGQIVCFLNENGTPTVPTNGSLQFQNEDAGSTDVNRFRNAGGGTVSGNSQGAVWYIYQFDQSGSGDPRWQQISTT